MLLKRLELAGFKSFARKTSFVFETPVTAVVGPNGSGKSNVAESLRWVLGEQALTSIRGRRGEDFIFAGSPGVSRLNVASATVVFDNVKRQFPLDFDEVAITREVHRDGENIYRLNDSRVRLRDVIELLSAVSLGASQHHVVSQGEADRLLSSNFLERREMIEDALGIKIYEYKRTEAKKKLEKTEGHRKEVDALRRELLPHLKFLEKQVEQIKKADTLREELRALLQTYLAAEEAYIKKEQSLLHGKKAALRGEREVLEGKLRELGKLREGEEERALRSAIETAEKELFSSRSAEGEESRALGKTEGALESQRELLKRSQEVQNEDAGATVPVNAVAAFVGELEGEVRGAIASENLSVLRAALERVRAAMQGFLERCRGHREDKTKERGAEIRREIEELERKAAGARAALASLAAKRTELEASLLRTRAELDAKLEKGREAERAHYELLAKKSAIENEERVLRLEEERLTALENDWKREQTEAAVLVGRDVLQGETLNTSREEQEAAKKKIERLKIRLEEMGVGGEDVLKEYEDTKEREAFLARELEDLRLAAEKLETLMDELGKQIDTEFRLGVEKINFMFTTYFATLFGGGGAKLSVVRPERRKSALVEDGGELVEETEIEVREGLDISVSVPRKKVKSLEALSGGERTLVSIALLFAVTAVKPPPFLVLDETDAALDEANSRKYGEMLEQLSQHTQLVLISHNRETMSHAGALYGVTLGPDGVSRVLSVKFEEASQMAAR